MMKIESRKKLLMMPLNRPKTKHELSANLPKKKRLTNSRQNKKRHGEPNKRKLIQSAA